jgi:hypothetical protein
MIDRESVVLHNVKVRLESPFPGVGCAQPRLEHLLVVDHVAKKRPVPGVECRPSYNPAF